MRRAATAEMTRRRRGRWLEPTAARSRSLDARPGRSKAAATHRHAGPWGASFDGTLADGKTRATGLTFERRWTTPGIHPYDEITWEYRTAGISSETGKSVFEQKDVEVPDFW